MIPLGANKSACKPVDGVCLTVSGTSYVLSVAGKKFGGLLTQNRGKVPVATVAIRAAGQAESYKQSEQGDVSGKYTG